MASSSSEAAAVVMPPNPSPPGLLGHTAAGVKAHLCAAEQFFQRGRLHRCQDFAHLAIDEAEASLKQLNPLSPDNEEPRVELLCLVSSARLTLCAVLSTLGRHWQALSQVDKTLTLLEADILASGQPEIAPRQWPIRVVAATLARAVRALSARKNSAATIEIRDFLWSSADVRDKILAKSYDWELAEALEQLQHLQITLELECKLRDSLRNRSVLGRIPSPYPTLRASASLEVIAGRCLQAFATELEFLDICKPIVCREICVTGWEAILAVGEAVLANSDWAELQEVNTVERQAFVVAQRHMQRTQRVLPPPTPEPPPRVETPPDASEIAVLESDLWAREVSRSAIEGGQIQPAGRANAAEGPRDAVASIAAEPSRQSKRTESASAMATRALARVRLKREFWGGQITPERNEANPSESAPPKSFSAAMDSSASRAGKFRYRNSLQRVSISYGDGDALSALSAFLSPPRTSAAHSLGPSTAPPRTAETALDSLSSGLLDDELTDSTSHPGGPPRTAEDIWAELHAGQRRIASSTSKAKPPICSLPKASDRHEKLVPKCAQHWASSEAAAQRVSKSRVSATSADRRATSSSPRRSVAAQEAAMTAYMPYEDLQKLPLAEGIRQALLIRGGGSLLQAMHILVAGESTSLGPLALEAGLRRLNIDWSRITGEWDFQVVFDAFDPRGEGIVEASELAGCKPLSSVSATAAAADGDKEGQDSPAVLWTEYVNSVRRTKSKLARPPLWDMNAKWRQIISQLDLDERHRRELAAVARRDAQPQQQQSLQQSSTADKPHMSSCTFSEVTPQDSSTSKVSQRSSSHRSRSTHLHTRPAPSFRASHVEGEIDAFWREQNSLMQWHSQRKKIQTEIRRNYAGGSGLLGGEVRSRTGHTMLGLELKRQLMNKRNQQASCIGEDATNAEVAAAVKVDFERRKNKISGDMRDLTRARRELQETKNKLREAYKHQRRIDLMVQRDKAEREAQLRAAAAAEAAASQQQQQEEEEKARHAATENSRQDTDGKLPASPKEKRKSGGVPESPQRKSDPAFPLSPTTPSRSLFGASLFGRKGPSGKTTENLIGNLLSVVESKQDLKARRQAAIQAQRKRQSASRQGIKRRETIQLKKVEAAEERDSSISLSDDGAASDLLGGSSDEN